MSELAFTRYDKPTDVLLLGPQVSFRLEEMKQKLCPAGVRVALIGPETLQGWMRKLYCSRRWKHKQDILR